MLFRSCQVLSGSECVDEDSSCYFDERCIESTCEKISCGECEYTQDHQCKSFECCSDSDCGEFSSCNMEIRECVEDIGCQQYLFNGNPENRIDIVFIGDGFSSYTEMKERLDTLLDKNKEGYGFFSVYPFNQYSNKFNVWMIKAPDFNHIKTGEDRKSVV